MQEGNVSGYEDRKALFPGGTCFPLSGEGKLSNNDKLDQLSVIFDVIGTPSNEDIAAVGKANDYIKSLRKSSGKPFEKVFPAADPSVLDLLKQMLHFNPKRRLTAAQALEHEFFQGVRQESLEQVAHGPLEAPEFLETNHVDLKELKRKIYEEVLWYRDSNTDSKPPERPFARVEK
jgi:mitogen-activated protein kinase 1/3